MYEHNTQHDLEDLPTTWGGYDKLPVRAKLFANTGTPMVAMSGKFHTSWGEFGGFKHPDALRYEAAAMIAFGVACNFGDQLHPLGEMEMDTYRNIGEAFEYVEQIEAYGIGGLAGGQPGAVAHRDRGGRRGHGAHAAGDADRLWRGRSRRGPGAIRNHRAHRERRAERGAGGAS